MKAQFFAFKTFFIIAFLGSSIFFISCKKTKKETPINNKEVKKEVIKESSIIDKKIVISKNPTVNIKRQQKITSPLVIEINSKGLWHASEGEIGTVSLVDEHNKILATGILFTSDDNWMTSGDAMFKTTLKFEAKKAASGKLVFKNRLVRKKDVAKFFEVPVTF